MLALLFLACCAALAAGYFIYGRFMERNLDVRADRVAPSVTLQDGVDYVPTKTAVLFGHHFSSIAGAGPIVGPIIAGLAFGWFPALLWILVGSIFIGGVHDFTALIASLRHRARSIGEMCRDLLNPAAYYVFLIFIWLTLMYVQIVFMDLTASTFVPVTQPETADLQLHQGGVVATASMLYIGLAVLFGLSLYRFNVPVGKATLIFVPLVFLALWVSHLLPLRADRIPEALLLGNAKNTWLAVLIVYCFLASILPVWILLQPRDYLSSFLLYACVGGGVVGLLTSAAQGTVAIRYNPFSGWTHPELKGMFPALFITIACGAVSGFHSIVASGTTSKQLSNEKSARTVAYGGMLVEAVLGLVALATVMVLADKPAGKTPVAIFAGGLGDFLAALHIPRQAAVTFGLMAVSSFLLTTLDTCTRLARFIFEEIFGLSGRLARYAGTAASLLLPALVVFRQIPGPGGKLMPAWQAVWPAFGATNQLLAALALLVVYAWLRRSGKRSGYVLLPMLFMCVTTVTALTQLAILNLFHKGSLLVGAICLVLDLLAVALIISTAWNLLRRRPAPVGFTPAPN
ncbi:MAG TPA: carbon starvation CstA family protein [Kiritimatiellia bacterium]|nr:carbon starvation CstA family protein [Kiritimatiellia bacterium]HRZ11156.1 carbon starvation CstA family protein [Kiritimatiellia bacterium]HSA19472.1 carbon starvation CstA family protein [Kiritimatiellia bacterium]